MEYRLSPNDEFRADPYSDGAQDRADSICAYFFILVVAIGCFWALISLGGGIKAF